MQYLLLIYAQEGGWESLSPEEQSQTMQGWGDYTQWLTDQGWMRGGDALEPTSSATTVRLKDDERLVTDGPFAETKEQLGGYYLLECDSLDDAIEAAGRCPGARYGSIELRPVADMTGPDASM